MSPLTPLNESIERALRTAIAPHIARWRETPKHLPALVDWQQMADDFILALGGSISLVTKNDWDRIRNRLRDLEQIEKQLDRLEEP